MVDGVEEAAARARTTAEGHRGDAVSEAILRGQRLVLNLSPDSGKWARRPTKRTDVVNNRAIVTLACFLAPVNEHMRYA